MAKNERVLTAAQAKALDKEAKDKFGISTLVLMENAGRAVSEEALKLLQNRPGKVAIFCGTGNNGGDGFCVARHLLTVGIKPDVYLAGKISDVKNEAKVNLGILLRLRQKIVEVNPENLRFIKAGIKKYGLIIDALLGVGLRGEIRHVYQELISIVNTAKACVLAIDIPSGLDATSGKVFDCCIKANKTVTFVAKKRGMISNIGKNYCGQIFTKSIGAPL
jgi:NAD(P)H-hydrate epimerase